MLSATSSKSNLHSSSRLSTPQIGTSAKLVVENPTLRIVYLSRLEPKQLGPISFISEEDKSSSKLLRDYSAFQVGPEKLVEAMSLIDPHYKESLIQAVVDRPSNNSIRAGLNKITGAEIRFPVSSGRQSYVQLEDGSFLGIKGSGQFILPDQPSFILHPGLTGKKKWFGFVGYHEIVRLLENRKIIEAAGQNLCFSRILGFRKIKSLKDDNQILRSVSELPTDDLGRAAAPHLVFYKTLSPLRLNKLPQILAIDPNLELTLNSLSPLARKALNLPVSKPASLDDWLTGITQQLARSEGFKAAYNAHKGTLHLQDINFVGQENDLEELVVSRDFPTQQERGANIKLMMLRDIYHCLVSHKLGKKISSIKSYESEFAQTYNNAFERF